MRIAVDAMGGDFAPRELVLGTCEAAEELDAELVLVGDEAAIKAELPGGKLPDGVSIIHASERIAMDEIPTKAVRVKRDSSLVIAARMLKERKVDALFTAGNTGAAVACGLIWVGRLQGIDRAYIALLVPHISGEMVLVDAGATVDCRPRHFVEMALMGSLYANTRLHIEHPKVALLNVGTEDNKGCKAVLAAKKALEQQPDLNFVGNIEGDVLFTGKVDVVVCDGFVGNVALKIAESSIKLTFAFLAREIQRRLRDKLAAAVLKHSALKRVASALDYSAYGGALLLGIDGTYIIGHGKSSAKAVRTALRVTYDSVKAGVVDKIRQAVPSQVSDLALYNDEQ